MKRVKLLTQLFNNYVNPDKITGIQMNRLNGFFTVNGGPQSLAQAHQAIFDKDAPQNLTMIQFKIEDIPRLEKCIAYLQSLYQIVEVVLGEDPNDTHMDIWNRDKRRLRDDIESANQNLQEWKKILNGEAPKDLYVGRLHLPTHLSGDKRF